MHRVELFQAVITQDRQRIPLCTSPATTENLAGSSDAGNEVAAVPFAATHPVRGHNTGLSAFLHGSSTLINLH